MVVCVCCFSDFAVLRDEDEDGYYGYTLDDLYLFMGLAHFWRTISLCSKGITRLVTTVPTLTIQTSFS